MRICRCKKTLVKYKSLLCVSCELASIVDCASGSRGRAPFCFFEYSCRSISRSHHRRARLLFAFSRGSISFFAAATSRKHTNTYRMPDLIQQMEVHAAKTNLTRARAAPRNNYRADKKMSYETDALRERKKHRRFIWLPREKQIAPHSARRQQIESAAMKVNFGFGSITRGPQS
jgi:hypothetical protein